MKIELEWQVSNSHKTIIQLT